MNAIPLAPIPSTSSDPRDAIACLEAENRLLRQELERLAVFRQLAYRDELTGLYNRRHFGERLAQEWSRAERFGASLALVMIDLDGFKRINDEAGHAKGDEVLAFVGRTLAAVCRAYDVACRLGGDEFAYLLPETDLSGARALVARLEEALAAAPDRPVLPAGLEIRFSVGIAVSSEVGAASELPARADSAMYADKRFRKAGFARAA